MRAHMPTRPEDIALLAREKEIFLEQAARNGGPDFLFEATYYENGRLKSTQTIAKDHVEAEQMILSCPRINTSKLETLIRLTDHNGDPL